MKKLSIIVVVAMLLLTAGAANAAVIFEDNFDSPTLSPEWLISPGQNSYSLTANPGHLRYTVDAWQYDKSLTLARPFSGDQWVLQAAVTYNLRPGEPTNNRTTSFMVREPGLDGTLIASVYRGVGVNDSNPGSNALQLSTGDPADPGTSAIFPNSSGPLPPDTWYFEIQRDKDHIAIRASNDGNDSTFEYQHEYTFPAGYLVNGHQDIEFVGYGWRGSNNPPGYVDFDFIRVVPEPTTLALLGLGNLALVRRRRG